MILYSKQTPAGTLWQFVTPLTTGYWALCYVPLKNTDLVGSLDLLAAVSPKRASEAVESHRNSTLSYKNPLNAPYEQVHHVTVSLRDRDVYGLNDVTPLHALTLAGRQSGFGVLELDEKVASQLFAGGGCARAGTVQQKRVDVTHTGAQVLGTLGASPETAVEIVYEVHSVTRELDIIAPGFAGFFSDTWLRVSQALAS